MKNNLKLDIESLLGSIRKIEEDKELQDKRFWGDSALIARALAEKYEELGGLYKKIHDYKSAVIAFEKASKEDMKFIDSEFAYDPPYVKELNAGRENYWKNKIAKLNKILKKKS